MSTFYRNAPVGPVAVCVCLSVALSWMLVSAAHAQRRRGAEVTLVSNRSAQFFVDGFRVGVGSRVDVVLTSESHEIVVSAEGYRDLSAWVSPPFVTSAPYQFVFTIQDELPPERVAAPGDGGDPPAAAPALPAEHRADGGGAVGAAPSSASPGESAGTAQAESDVPPAVDAEAPSDGPTFTETFFVLDTASPDHRELYSVCASSLSSVLLASGRFVERSGPELTTAVSECVEGTSAAAFARECQISLARTQVDLVFHPEFVELSEGLLVAIGATRPLQAGGVWREDAVVDAVDPLLGVREACASLGRAFVRVAR